MHRGYTKRWRKRWDKNYHHDPLLWMLMDFFIDFANYKDSEVFFPNVGVIPLKRGQHIFGRSGKHTRYQRLLTLELSSASKL